jgi:RNA polymerase sigma factor (sigma-70 family)
MESLIELIREYRQAQSLEQKLLAADKLVALIAPRLEGYILRRCPPDMADEVLQETMRSIAKGLLSFKGLTDDAFTGWCNVIARCRISDAGRKEQASREILTSLEDLWDTVHAAAPEVPLAAGDRLDLEYAMNLLKAAKPPCYDYLWCYYILDWDYNSIAEEYGLTYDAVRMQIKRCLELAQSLLG